MRAAVIEHQCVFEHWFGLLCAARIFRRALPFFEELFRGRALVYARKSGDLCSCVTEALRELVVANAAVSFEH